MLAHVYQYVKVCSLCVQMQVNPGFFNALNVKLELESGQAADSSDAAQYLSRLIKRPVPEKPTELWKTYLRRCDAHALFIILFLLLTPGSQYPAVFKSIILHWLQCDSCFYLTLNLCFVILTRCLLLSCHCRVPCLSLRCSDVEIKHLATTNDIMCIKLKSNTICHGCICAMCFHAIQPHVS